ncbi:MAG: oxygen-independent coproporphyrinogen III oxidase [Novosphingobium sp.]|nr:oxygen-independent coproporphyrinogen III oxidase [Novosphingobium sp.]
MWSYHPELLETPVPRYTSYPTAAEFGPDVGAEAFGDALQRVTGDISLYLHIPFCQSICWYCGCNTERANRPERLASYLEALHREIALVGAGLSRTARVRRIAFGGGSPNAISPIDFVRLIVALTQSFPLADPVLSVELDPRSLDEGWGPTLKAVGVRRASLGVQTFDPALQRAIGRVQPYAMIERCTDLLRGAGVTSVNFDLMYGLPGQGPDQLADTLDKAIGLGADRIALFGYAHVPEMFARQRRIDASALPDQAARFAFAAQGYQRLVSAGYVPVGFDHFALPGDPLAQAATSGRLHRNFQGFTDDAAPVLIGLGASAISSFPELLVQNEKNAGRYRMMLSQKRLTGARGIRRSGEDRARGALIEQLLCGGRTPLEPAIAQVIASRLAPFVRRGLAIVADDVLVITPEGLPYARAIAALFDRYRAQSERTFSSAV